MPATPLVTKDRELATGDQRDGLKIKVTDAKGPRSGGSSYQLCYDCNKVIYNIFRDGAMAPGQRNRFYCTCDGEQSPMIEQVVTVFDVEDVTTPEEAKQFKEWYEANNKTK
jgi:hypothetical protein